MPFNPNLYIVIVVVNSISIPAAALALWIQISRLRRNRTDHLAFYTTLSCLTLSYGFLSLTAMIRDPTCQIKKSVTSWLQLQTTMLTTTLAFLLLKPWNIRSWICLVPIFVAGVIGGAAVPFYKTADEEECWHSPETTLASFGFFVVPQCVFILINLGVAIFIFGTQKSSVYPLPRSYLLYLLIPALIEFGPIVSIMIYYSSGYSDQGLSWWSWLSPGLGSMLVLFVLFLDPHLWQHGHLRPSRPSIMISAPQLDDVPTPSHTSWTTPSAASQQDVQEKYLQQPSLPLPSSPPALSATSLVLTPADMQDLFVKCPEEAHISHVLSPALMAAGPAPCYRVEEAVPWRVLEHDEEETDDPAVEEKSDDRFVMQDDEKKGKTIDPPRLSRSSSRQLRSPKESWLSLDDDEEQDGEKRPSLESGGSSPASVSQWLSSRREGSMDLIRDHLSGSTKNLRLWRRPAPQHEAAILVTSPPSFSALPIVHEEH
ncbi:hypothetical protein DM01DRAFT_1369951 [Hesseltinella vesiculosa]|uniref:Uncharacterized protein n=1 Tax=Hesseltinella vesiculosa TaxID=101127 RepID=A0A1X2GVH4_9FUNG|nr:hypothetical protein DM01DRAFT_1369951 [Hesseltinella vesiculosa]